MFTIRAQNVAQGLVWDHGERVGALNSHQVLSRSDWSSVRIRTNHRDDGACQQRKKGHRGPARIERLHRIELRRYAVAADREFFKTRLDQFIAVGIRQEHMCSAANY